VARAARLAEPRAVSAFSDWTEIWKARERACSLTASGSVSALDRNGQDKDVSEASPLRYRRGSERIAERRVAPATL